MDTTTLFKKFDEAHAWNGILFTINKIAKTSISLILFSRLSSLEFSAWANSNSFVYLLLLWFNFGFSRSIPQFAPYFAKNAHAKKRFIAGLIRFKCIASLGACIFLFSIAPSLARLVSLEAYLPLFYLGCCLFVVESIKSIFQLLFYSYFWHKRFNVLDGFCVTLNAALTLFLAMTVASTSHLLYMIFFSHIATTLLLIGFSYFMLGALEDDKNYQGNESVDRKGLIKYVNPAFLKMWKYTCYKKVIGNSISRLLKLKEESTAMIGVDYDDFRGFERCAVPVLKFDVKNSSDHSLDQLGSYLTTRLVPAFVNKQPF